MIVSRLAVASTPVGASMPSAASAVATAASSGGRCYSMSQKLLLSSSKVSSSPSSLLLSSTSTTRTGLSSSRGYRRVSQEARSTTLSRRTTTTMPTSLSTMSSTTKTSSTATAACYRRLQSNYAGSRNNKSTLSFTNQPPPPSQPPASTTTSVSSTTKISGRSRQRPSPSSVSSSSSSSSSSSTSSTSSASSSAKAQQSSSLSATRTNQAAVEASTAPSGIQPNQFTICATKMAKQTNVRLTEPELALLRQRLRDIQANSVADSGGTAATAHTANTTTASSTASSTATATTSSSVSKSIDAHVHMAAQQALERQYMREVCLSTVEQPTSASDKFGSKLITYLDNAGKALFAVVGTQIAGEAGMNIVGATLVGCISCLGGGTLNNVLYGTSSLLIADRPSGGVNWVRQPSVLFLAVMASVATFYGWPLYCREQAKEELLQVFGKENLEPDGSVGRKAFIHACTTDLDFQESVRVALGKTETEEQKNTSSLFPSTEKVLSEEEELSELFDLVDSDHSGYVELDEMQYLVGNRFNKSPTIYFLDTIALSALAVAAVHQAITRGLNPFIAATSGITICFGGILRDVLCGRDLAIGGQSYAMSTGAGSSAYVLLRELSIRFNIAIPIVARILFSVGLTSSLRAYEFYTGDSLLKPMHYDSYQEKMQKQTILDQKKANDDARVLGFRRRDIVLQRTTTLAGMPIDMQRTLTNTSIDGLSSSGNQAVVSLSPRLSRNPYNNNN